ncbi:hypothetical protein SLOPH_476 [Spraguea lophii 42_110]|uniref:Uncharacterized protein n=1 Tax=Spraguea lophii (strain 42_110) TaxID=1358809 RepID=S7W6A0_SPRLO|nr:hypothetical protein SLOPH_476 [Spraguea lophii 42_110]
MLFLITVVTFIYCTKISKVKIHPIMDNKDVLCRVNSNTARIIDGQDEVAKKGKVKFKLIPTDGGFYIKVNGKDSYLGPKPKDPGVVFFSTPEPEYVWKLEAGALGSRFISENGKCLIKTTSYDSRPQTKGNYLHTTACDPSEKDQNFNVEYLSDSSSDASSNHKGDDKSLPERNDYHYTPGVVNKLCRKSNGQVVLRRCRQYTVLK